MRKHARRLLASLVTLVVVGFGMTIPAVSTATAVAGEQHPIAPLRHGTSTNWAGYAAYGAAGRFTSVTATWVQPAVDCSVTSAKTYASFWVGLDGYNSSTVEQLGTEGDCSGGTARYYSWWEMYPRAAYYATVTVTPGHSYTAAVTTVARKGTFVLTLVDNTTHQTFTTTQKSGGAKAASAEVVAEAPWNGGVLPLAKFGAVNFTGSKANGVGIGTFAPSLDPITMLNPAGMKATPSGFTDGAKQNFSITWSAS